MDVLVGVLILALGALVAFFGLRVFFIALPILGFIAGMGGGLALMDHIFDNSFLSTTTGIIVGLVLGIIFAIFAYLWWYIGVILGAAFIGASLGSGLMDAFNVNTQWVILIAAIIGAIILGLLTVLLNLPIYWVIVNTAFVGASLAVAGIMLIFNRIDRVDLSYGTVSAAIDESWIWVIAWIVVAALGLGAQLASMRPDPLPTEKWTKAPMAMPTS